MVQFRPQAREIIAKVVYYGPPLGGKTTNLQTLYRGYPSQTRGELVVVPTGGDRTIFFDFLPIDAGTLRGMTLRIQLYTVPGQVHFNATRQIVLRGVDGVVFVADSQPAMVESNRGSWDNLKENLLLQGIALSDLPHVLQFNKRDLSDLLTVEAMDELLNEYQAPFFEAVATDGRGVEETLQAAVRLVVRSLRDRFRSVLETGSLGIEDRRLPRTPAPARAAAGAPPNVVAFEDGRRAGEERTDADNGATRPVEVAVRSAVTPEQDAPVSVLPASGPAATPGGGGDVAGEEEPKPAEEAASSAPVFGDADEPEPAGEAAFAAPVFDDADEPEHTEETALTAPVFDDADEPVSALFSEEEEAPFVEPGVGATSTEEPADEAPPSAMDAGEADADAPEGAPPPEPEADPGAFSSVAVDEPAPGPEESGPLDDVPFTAVAPDEAEFTAPDLDGPDLVSAPFELDGGLPTAGVAQMAESPAAPGDPFADSGGAAVDGDALSAEVGEDVFMAPTPTAAAGPAVPDDVDDGPAPAGPEDGSGHDAEPEPAHQEVGASVGVALDGAVQQAIVQRVRPQAIAQYGEVRELELEVPVPSEWVSGRRMTLQLRLTLVPEEVGHER